jgi:hypothetical protein
MTTFLASVYILLNVRHNDPNPDHDHDLDIDLDHDIDPDPDLARVCFLQQIISLPRNSR